MQTATHEGPISDKCNVAQRACSLQPESTASETLGEGGGVRILRPSSQRGLELSRRSRSRVGMAGFAAALPLVLLLLLLNLLSSALAQAIAAAQCAGAAQPVSVAAFLSAAPPFSAPNAGLFQVVLNAAEPVIVPKTVVVGAGTCLEVSGISEATQPVTLSGDKTRPLFDVKVGGTLTISDATLQDGLSGANMGGAITVRQGGSVNLTRVNLLRNVGVFSGERKGRSFSRQVTFITAPFQHSVCESSHVVVSPVCCLQGLSLTRVRASYQCMSSARLMQCMNDCTIMTCRTQH